MKKLFMSLIIFVVIITSGIMIMSYFKRSSTKISDNVDEITTLVKQNDWEKAKSNMESVQENWNKVEKTWAILTDHIEIDNIEMSMIKSSEYIKTKNIPLTLAELENLKYMVQHIYDNEVINLKNIF